MHAFGGLCVSSTNLKIQQLRHFPQQLALSFDHSVLSRKLRVHGITSTWQAIHKVLKSERTQNGVRIGASLHSADLKLEQNVKSLQGQELSIVKDNYLRPSTWPAIIQPGAIF